MGMLMWVISHVIMIMIMIMIMMRVVVWLTEGKEVVVCVVAMRQR